MSDNHEDLQRRIADLEAHLQALKTQAQSSRQVAPLQVALRTALVELLSDRTQPLPVAERVRAGFRLGDLGDPRVPVTVAAWQRELERAQAGDTDGYFCRVPAGTYIIGSADDDPDAQEEEKPQHQVELPQPFLIARFPITNAQWQEWVVQSGIVWSVTGCDDFTHPNQPMFGLTWHQCTFFCTWLSDQLGTTIRLPTETEWEAAARGGDARRYPWGDDWRDDHAATGADQDLRGWRRSVPVGCYPAGAAPCGALDMVGNIDEWTADIWRSYPGAAAPSIDAEQRVLRGGAWDADRVQVRCAARNGYHDDSFIIEGGLRVMAPLAPAPISDN